MDRETNYFVVGAFVLLVIGMAFSFVYWYTDHRDKRTYHRYEIYYDGTVSGLTAGSPVRYLGVDVGKVARIMLDPRERRRVEVIADIDAEAPIDARTRALLSLQGVTGLLFIDLEQDPNVPAAGPLPQGARYPVIRSAPSDLGVLLRRLPELASHAIELIDHMDHVFSADNVRAFDTILRSASAASESSPELLREIRRLIADLRHSAEQVDGAAADFRAVTNGARPDLEATLANVRRITDSLSGTSERLNALVSQTEPGLARFTAEGLPELERLLRDSREAARDFRELARSLGEDPSRVLYEPKDRGVAVAP